LSQRGGGARGSAVVGAAASLCLLATPVAAEPGCPRPGSLAASPDPVGASCAEAGILPSEAAARGVAQSPELTRLPRPALPPLPATLAGEALLALPVSGPGATPPPFELGAGAQVAESYWSPLLCAVVARIVGDASARPDELVPDVPEGGRVTAHHLYRTAAADLPGAAEARADPYRRLQWALDELAVEEAWDIGAGAGVRIAVLDSTPDAAHPDLGRIRVAPLEGGPPPEPALHGTLVAALIAASAGNGVGIAGLAPAAEVVAIPVCTPEPGAAADRCRLFDTLRGLDAAWDLRAGAINLSLVGPPNPLLAGALRRLDALGVLVVAAAGNEPDAGPRYPAAVGPVLAVSARDRVGRADPRASLGPWVDLEAPGVEILSAVPGGGYAFGDGSSLAAAHVTGVVGLLLSTGASPTEVRAALQGTARPAAPGSGRPPAIAPICASFTRLGRPCNP